MLSEVIKERAEHESLLQWRYPWFNICYNYLIGLLVILLFASFAVWGMNVRAEMREAQAAATARAEQQAQEQARLEQQRQAEEEKQKAHEELLKQESETVAKAFYGIRLFVERYHYTDKDLETYARCIFNRYDAGKGVNSIYAIVSRPEQFTGYSDNNTILTENKEKATAFVNAWHEEDSKPCDLSYQYAELRPEGIFLTTKPDAGPYDHRWHA